MNRRDDLLMQNSIIMGTQVSLSRNITDYPFPHKLSESESNYVTNKIYKIIERSANLEEENFILKKINDITSIEKNTLVEMDIINKKFANSNNVSILINKDKTKCLLINGDDHIEIKVFRNDFDLDEAYKLANEIDNILEEKLEYAFDDKIGYLTSCPVNAGIGLKISVTLHLPVLCLQKKIETYYNIGHKLGINIKGIINEKSNTLGSMYEISNKNIIGRSEKNVIESLKSITKDIINKEIETREMLKIEASIELEDEVYRSLGIIQHARIISAQEVMKHLSNIKLGIEMNFINDINLEKVSNLMKGMKPTLGVRESSNNNDDVQRANFIRNEFTLANRNSK